MLFRSVGFAEHVVVANQEILDLVFVDLLGLLTERGHLDDFSAAEEHVGEAEAASDDPAVSEELSNVLGAGAGRDVEVFGGLFEEEVPDASTDEVGLEPGLFQATNDAGGVLVDAGLVEDDVVPSELGPEVAFVDGTKLVGVRFYGEIRKLRRRRMGIFGSTHQGPIGARAAKAGARRENYGQ